MESKQNEIDTLEAEKVQMSRILEKSNTERDEAQNDLKKLRLIMNNHPEQLEKLSNDLLFSQRQIEELRKSQTSGGSVPGGGVGESKTKVSEKESNNSSNNNNVGNVLLYPGNDQNAHTSLIMYLFDYVKIAVVADHLLTKASGTDLSVETDSRVVKAAAAKTECLSDLVTGGGEGLNKLMTELGQVLASLAAAAHQTHTTPGGPSSSDNAKQLELHKKWLKELQQELIKSDDELSHTKNKLVSLETLLNQNQQSELVNGVLRIERDLILERSRSVSSQSELEFRQEELTQQRERLSSILVSTQAKLSESKRDSRNRGKIIKHSKALLARLKPYIGLQIQKSIFEDRLYKIHFTSASVLTNMLKLLLLSV